MDPQIVNIVKYLIRETPIGHLKTLLDNLKVIVGFEVIDCKDVNDEILLYEQEHLKQIDLGGDKIIYLNLIKTVMIIFMISNRA